MKTLNYYISLATKGNAEAAYEAAKRMHYEKYHEVIVQSMLRKAGTLGSVNAQRWLGFIGLSGKLVDPDSTVANVRYLSDCRYAYSWFERAALQGDAISSFAMFKCLQYGIGVDRDEEKAQSLLENISGKLSFDVLPLLFFFDGYGKDREEKPTKENSQDRKMIQELLAG